ncbi:DUF257 family protein [Thermococcus sp.]
MEIKSLRDYLLREIWRGGIVLVEYPSNYPIEDFVWGTLLPTISEQEIIVDDFLGIGDLTFRNYLRKESGKGYKTVLDTIKNIKIIKIGPGRGSYGNVINEIPLTYDTQEFMDRYYNCLKRLVVEFGKPAYFLTFGLAEYLYFGGEKAIRTILTLQSVLPIEDWTSIYFINKDLIDRNHLAILEEISSSVLEILWKEKRHDVIIRK